jgi:hypothetical protein
VCCNPIELDFIGDFASAAPLLFPSVSGRPG